MREKPIEFRDPLTQFIFDNELCIPLEQVMGFVLFITFCLLFKKHRLGLLTAYLFVFYCGFIANAERFINMFGATGKGMYVYIFFGIAMALMASVGFMQDTKIEDAIREKLKPKPKKPIIRFITKDMKTNS